VIGYVGIKTIIINKAYEEIDEYLVLNTRDGGIFAVDSFGATSRIATNFEEWIAPELLRATLKEKYTSNLTVMVFDDELKAEEARLKLLKLQRRVSLSWKTQWLSSKSRTAQLVTTRCTGQQERVGLPEAYGLIVGSIFLNPLIGAALGAVAGALSGSLSDVGIDDRFIKELSEKFKPGCSALFTLVRKADPDGWLKSFSASAARCW